MLECSLHVEIAEVLAYKSYTRNMCSCTDREHNAYLSRFSAIAKLFTITFNLLNYRLLFVANLKLKTDEVDFPDLFSRNICKPDFCLYYLLPPPRGTSVISRIRSST